MGGLYSPEGGFIFIHVPKCAGSSITQMLASKAPSKRFEDIEAIGTAMRRENERGGERVDSASHARARDARDAFGADMFERLLTFAVIRNPWDRLLSWYHYRRRPDRKPTPAILSESLNDFVLWACANKPASLTDRLCDHEDRILVDKVLRFESLQQDFADLSQQLFGERLMLPHTNASPYTHGEEFSAETCKEVRRAYRRDFELFDYPDQPI